MAMKSCTMKRSDPKECGDNLAGKPDFALIKKQLREELPKVNAPDRLGKIWISTRSRGMGKRDENPSPDPKKGVED